MPINATLQAERYRDPSRVVFGLRTDDKGNPINAPEQVFAVPRDVLKEGHIHVRRRTQEAAKRRWLSLHSCSNSSGPIPTAMPVVTYWFPG